MESLVGILILTVSAVLFFVVMIQTVFTNRKLEHEISMPVAEPLDASAPIPAWLNNWQPWLSGAIALILLAYGPMIVQLVIEATYWSPGFRVW